MNNSLKTLSRIQKFQIDEQRKVLNEWLLREEKILKELKRLFLELEHEKEFAAQNGCLGDFGAYIKRYKNAKEAHEEELAAVRKKIEEIRDIISDMFKEQKTYDIVNENREKRAQKEEELKEQKMLDEIGTNNYIKKNKNPQ